MATATGGYPGCPDPSFVILGRDRSRRRLGQPIQDPLCAAIDDEPPPGCDCSGLARSQIVVNTTMWVILFTIFLLGGTSVPLLKALDIPIGIASNEVRV